MPKTKQPRPAREVAELLDACLGSIARLLGHIVDARNSDWNDSDLGRSYRLMHVKDARVCVRHLDELLQAVDKAVRGTLPPRPKRPTGLGVNPQGLLAFDKDYFHYFDPADEEYNEFYRAQEDDRDALLRHLATWAFDEDDEPAVPLKEIKNSFGAEVAKAVRQKLKNRDHDT